MSYSFTVKSPNRKQAKNDVSAELQKVVVAQPVHENDINVAEDAAGALLDVVEEPSDGNVLQVSVSGSLSWSADDVFTGANLNISVATVKAE